MIKLRSCHESPEPLPLVFRIMLFAGRGLCGVQRGNNREKIFFAEATRKKYLNWLKEYADLWGVKILAYCLMTNHIHLLVKPDKMESLANLPAGRQG